MHGIKRAISKGLLIPEETIGTHALRHARAQHLSDIFGYGVRDLVSYINWDNINMPMLYTKSDENMLKEKQKRAIVPEPKSD